VIRLIDFNGIDILVAQFLAGCRKTGSINKSLTPASLGIQRYILKNTHYLPQKIKTFTPIT